MPADRILELKVTLRDVSPLIWRRFRVSAEISLAKLHEVLQVAMGWENRHLHEFRCPAGRFGRPDSEDPELADDRKVRLADVLNSPGDRLGYWYDFGDDWWHDVEFEREVAPDPGVRYPQVGAGERACPPEDCGGPPGYAGFLEAIRDPRHLEHEALVEWVGGAFDPEALDLGLRNAALHPGAKSRAARSRKGTTTREKSTRPNVTPPRAPKETPPRPRGREAVLRQFLGLPTQPSGTLTFDELRGFLFAIASSPVLVRPSEWLPAVFGAGEPQFETREQAETVINGLMETYNEAAKVVERTGPIVPRAVGIDTVSMASLQEWSRGFCVGYELVEDAWDDVREAMKPDVELEVLRALALFRIVADPKRVIDRTGLGEAAIREAHSHYLELLPGALTRIAHTGVAAYRASLRTPPIRRSGPAVHTGIGRNDACPCGSGRKYKQCCMGN